MFIALPVLICCSATLSLSGTYGIIQGVYPNSGSAAAVVPGTLSEPNVARTLPEPWFPKLWVSRMFQNWCSGDSRTLAQSRLWLLKAREPWDPGILTSRNPEASQNPLFPEPCSNPGSRNLGFPEPCPESWFPEPWVPGTLVPETGETRRTLVRGTLGSRNLAPNPGSRNPGSRNRRNEAAGSSSAPDHPEGYGG